MSIVLKQMRRVALAVVALGSIGVSGQAFAQNTQSGTSVNNTATVNYSVASVAQTPITASTSFVVDTYVRFTLSGGSAVTGVTPGTQNLTQTFVLTNTSNIDSDFVLTGTNATGDNFNLFQPGTSTDGVNVYVDTNTNGTYDAGTDTLVTSAAFSLARGASRTYFVVGDAPLSAANTNVAGIELNAEAQNPATSAAWVATAGADVQGTVQIVVGNTAAQGTGSFTIATATLAVTKTSAVISDPVNGTGANRKAVPGSVIEYSIQVTNNGSAAATLQNITDPLTLATMEFLRGQYPGGRDVRVVGAATTYCDAEDNADGNADGCLLAGASSLVVGGSALPVVGAGQTVTVSFQIRIR
jgi:uncharacterized repeat protein (TIGR01451 family)